MPFRDELKVDGDGNALIDAAKDPNLAAALNNEALKATTGLSDPEGVGSLLQQQGQGGVSGGGFGFPPGLAPQTSTAGLDVGGMPDHLITPAAEFFPPPSDDPNAGYIQAATTATPTVSHAALTEEDIRQLALGGPPAEVKGDESKNTGDKAKVKCPSCKAENPAAAKKCARCDRSLVGIKGGNFSQDEYAAAIYNTQGLNLAQADDDGLIWKVACKTGTLALSPGPGQVPIEKPLELTPELFDDMVLSAEERAFPHITVPETHANKALENTGYVRKWEVLDRDALLADQRFLEIRDETKAIIEADDPDTRYLLAGIDFTDSKARTKAEEGSIPDTSIGVKFNYRNTRTGKLYKAAWEHLALTPMPWVDGLVPFCMSQGGKVFNQDEVPENLAGIYMPLDLAMRISQHGDDYNEDQARSAISALEQGDEWSWSYEVRVEVATGEDGKQYILRLDPTGYDEPVDIERGPTISVHKSLDTLMPAVSAAVGGCIQRKLARQARYKTMGAIAEYSQRPDGQGLALSITFNPKEHPRDWHGKFRDVVDLMDYDDVVDLPDGTSIHMIKKEDHTLKEVYPEYEVVDAKGQTIKRTESADVAVDEAVDVIEGNADYVPVDETVPDPNEGKGAGTKKVQDLIDDPKVPVTKKPDADVPGSNYEDRKPGEDYITKEGDTFAGEPIEPGTLLKWDDEAQTHYPAGKATEAGEYIGDKPTEDAVRTRINQMKDGESFRIGVDEYDTMVVKHGGAAGYEIREYDEDEDDWVGQDIGISAASAVGELRDNGMLEEPESDPEEEERASHRAEIWDMIDAYADDEGKYTYDQKIVLPDGWSALPTDEEGKPSGGFNLRNPEGDITDWAEDPEDLAHKYVERRDEWDKAMKPADPDAGDRANVTGALHTLNKDVDALDDDAGEDDFWEVGANSLERVENTPGIDAVDYDSLGVVLEGGQVVALVPAGDRAQFELLKGDEAKDWLTDALENAKALKSDLKSDETAARAQYENNIAAFEKALKRFNLSQDAPIPEASDLHEEEHRSSLPSTLNASRTQETSQMPPKTQPRSRRQSPTVERLLASQQADLEAAQQRISDLEGELQLAQGQLSQTGQTLHEEAVNKRVTQLQDMGYAPALCLAVREVLLEDKAAYMLPQDNEGLALSVQVPDAKDDEDKTKTLRTATDVVNHLLASIPTSSEGDAARLAALGNSLSLAHQAAHSETNPEEEARQRVDEWEKEAHPERFNEDGTRKTD